MISGSTATYTPNNNFNGSDSFTFFANDGVLNSDEATVSVTVSPVNDAPTFVTSSLGDVDEDVAYSFTLDVDDIDNADDDLSVSISSGPSWLSVSGLSLSGTPSDSDVGTSTVLLNLSDGDIITSGSFEITVNAVNDPPVAENQSVSLNEDEIVTIYAYGNDEDSQGLAFTITSDPAHGTLSSQREFATYALSLIHI